MKTDIFQSSNMVKNHLNPKIANLYIILLALTFYLLPLVSFLFGTDVNRYTTYMYFYSISSYTIIVLGIIILNINEVSSFQDYFTLSIIVLSCFLRSASNGNFELLYRIYMDFLGVVILIYMVTNRKKITMPNPRSFFIGLLWSAGTVVILAFLYATLESVHGSLPPDLPSYIVNMSVFQISYVAVIEESVFRGLLLGFMSLGGYEEKTALFVQAVLFWGYHYIDITKTTEFFVLLPLFTLSATWIIKKYNMLHLSIIMHFLVNVFARVFVAVL